MFLHSTSCVAASVRDLVRHIPPAGIVFGDQIFLPDPWPSFQPFLTVQRFDHGFMPFKIDESLDVIPPRMRHYSSRPVLFQSLSQIPSRPDVDRSMGLVGENVDEMAQFQPPLQVPAQGRDGVWGWHLRAVCIAT